MYNYTLQDLANKIDYEGGVGEALFYFGREVPVYDVDVKAAWRTAYDAVMALAAMIPEVSEDGE